MHVFVVKFTGLNSDVPSDALFRSVRARRSPASVFSWANSGGPRYSARATRTFSSDEIDAFNQGLHRKRPKFIGKRHAIDDSVGDLTKQRSADGVWNGAPAGVDGAMFQATADKRTPPRKFIGRRSDIYDVTFDGESRDASKRNQATPRRKFVGKRPANRKFVGKRFGSDWRDDETETISPSNERLRCSDVTASSGADDGWLSGDDSVVLRDQSAGSDSDHVTESKRAPRKFLG